MIVNKILQKAHSRGSLITATVLTALGANIVLCDQYMTVGQTVLVNFLKELKEDGRYDRIYKKWFTDSEWFRHVR